MQLGALVPRMLSMSALMYTTDMYVHSMIPKQPRIYPGSGSYHNPSGQNSCSLIIRNYIEAIEAVEAIPTD